MNKIIRLFLAFLLPASMVSCGIDEMRDDLIKLENRVENLESYADRMNASLEGLQAFIEGGKTISKVTGPDENGKYLLDLSDGTQVELYQGTEGVVTYPEIRVGDDGFWYINDVRQDDCKAVGDNAAVPEFRVNASGNWEVSTDGGNVWTDKLVDTDGDGVCDKEVKAVPDSGEGAPVSSPILDARMEGDVFVVELQDGSEYSLPIVEGLAASIKTPADGRFVEGEWYISGSATTEVVIKGDGYKYFVTAPAGWTATVSEPDADGNATLTVTAPASSVVTKAGADNTADVVLQVNKGLYWAVDKIRVVQGEPMSLYDIYQSGKDITVEGVVINKETYGDAVFVRKSDVDETAGTPKVAEQKCVYFLEAGAKLYWDTAKPESLDKSHFAVIVISDALDRSATLTRNVPDGSGGIKRSTIYFGEHTKIVMKNVTYDFDRGLATDGNNDDVCHFDFIADNCNLNFNTNNASLVKKNKSGRLNSLIIRNSTVVMPKNKIKVIDGGLSGVEGEASVIMENTRFYSNANAGEAIDGMSIGNLSCAMKSVIIKNNIFMELPINDAAGGALIQANSVSDLDLSGNIFYKTAFSTADRSAVLSLDSAPSVEESQWNDNICVISEPMALAPIYDGLGNYVFRMTFTDALDVFQSIGPRQGTYVLIPEYASYGPQEN